MHGRRPIQRRTLMLLTHRLRVDVLADIVWAMSKVDGSYMPGGVSDVIYLSCYLWLAPRHANSCAERRHRQASAALSASAQDSMPYVAMLMSFGVLVYVESSTAPARSPR
jgi:hypothetical protein